MIYQPRTVYPKEAKRAGIHGVVKLDVVIGRNGDVDKIHIVSGDPALVPAAVKSVEDWRYAPTYLNGEPVEIKTRVDVPFTLSQ